MRIPLRVAVPFLSVAFLLVGTMYLAISAEADTKHYACRPCGLPCDDVVYDKPGTCPKCGMPLITQEAARRIKEAAARARKKVAILIFDGVEIIDYTGPWEIFGAAGFDVFTVAEKREPVTTAMGMTVLPDHTFADAPRPDVLVVPGGGVTAARESGDTLRWVKETAGLANQTMSVCNGAFILASAGLLEGLAATTTSANIAKLKAEYPGIRLVDDQRFVDNGRIVTTAGLTAGIDGALHVLSKMLGQGLAQRVALAEEYDWRPGSGFARAALADRLIPDIDMDAIGTWTLVNTEGDRERWEMEMRGTSDRSAPRVLEYIARELATKGKWTRVETPSGGGLSTLVRWTFNGRDGKPWTGTLTIRTLSEKSHQYAVELTIARGGAPEAGAPSSVRTWQAPYSR
jgi:putative intracellular protease/amidase